MPDDLTLPIITIGLSGLITVGGTIFNYYLNQRSKRLDEQRERLREAEKLVARYAKPLALAAKELGDRLESILHEERHGRLWLWPDWKPSPDPLDELPPITYEYYHLSTLYIIGQLFAWIDIMRKEETFLPFSDQEIDREFQTKLDNCIRAFSDSRISTGAAVFRHQQRAIGEQMSEQSEKDNALHCISYSTFVEKYEEDERYRRWFEPVESLVLKLEREGDPRMKRIQRVADDLAHFKDFVHNKMGIQLAEGFEAAAAGHAKAVHAAKG